VNHRPSAGAERIEMSQTVMEFMQQLWLALVMAWYLQAYVEVSNTRERKKEIMKLFIHIQFHVIVVMIGGAVGGM
jgi:hypothetical protein